MSNPFWFNGKYSILTTKATKAARQLELLPLFQGDKNTLSWTHMWPQMGWNWVRNIWISTCPTHIYFLVPRHKMKVLCIVCMPQPNCSHPGVPRCSQKPTLQHTKSLCCSDYLCSTCPANSVLSAFNELIRCRMWTHSPSKKNKYISIWEIPRKYDNNQLLDAL